MPCTPAGVMELLREAGAELEGARAVVLGRSILVGKPLAQLLLGANATVTHCHSRTRDLPAVCREADVLIAAVGSPGLVTGDMVREGAIVIDVGTNRTDDGLVGDVDFEAAARARRRDHAGARRRGADDARDAAREHAAGRAREGTGSRTPGRRQAPLCGRPAGGNLHRCSGVASRRDAGKHRSKARRAVGHPPRQRPPTPVRPPPAPSLAPGTAAPEAARAERRCSRPRRYAARRMDLRRLRAGEWITAVSGAALLVVAVPALVRRPAATPSRPGRRSAFLDVDASR